MSLQTVFPCKPFLTDCTHVRPWLVITWMLSDIITISFNVYLKRLRFINVISFTLKCLGVPCIRTTQQAYVWYTEWVQRRLCFFCLTIMLETFCEVSSSRNELQRPLKVTINDIVDRYILQLCHNAGRHKLSLQMVTGKYDNIIRCCALLIRQKKPLYRRQLETTSTFR